MILFKKNHIVRKWTATLANGRESLSYKDSVFEGDVQNPSDSSARSSEGGRREPRLKVWSDTAFTPTDQITGTRPDWIWSDGWWWQCVSCRWAHNTLLAHYVSEFVRVPENEPPEHTGAPEVTV